MPEVVIDIVITAAAAAAALASMLLPAMLALLIAAAAALLLLLAAAAAAAAVAVLQLACRQVWVVELAGVAKCTPAVAHVKGTIWLVWPQRQAPAASQITKKTDQAGVTAMCY
jgi:hypothetical protein